MSQKNKKLEESEHSSDQDYEGDEDELDIEEEIINKIKALPTLKQKVHCIALNHYLEQKRSIDEQMQKEVQQLEQQFRTRFNPFISDMNKIINGQYDYKNQDFEGAGDILTGEELASKDFYAKREKIPEYWLKVFLNSQVLAEQVHEIDEPLLKHLEKIEAEKSQDLKKFSVYFYFSENEWFSNSKVAKHFDIDETQVKKAYGDEINWKEGKNITVKTVKKKSKKGGKKTKQVKQDSFFNLFNQIDNNTDNEENDAESQNDEDEVEQLENQYQMCEHIYEEVIPRNLEFFLGVAPGGMDDCCGDEDCTEAACSKGGKANKVEDEDDE